MDDATLQPLRAELEEDRAQQMAYLEEHGTGPDTDVVTNLGVGSSGFSDAGQQAEERSEVLAAIEGARHRVHQIDEALARMDEGTYGECANCGQQIPEARLEVRPLSVLCVECAAKSEGR